MPNMHSHTVVLADYKTRGLLDDSRPVPPYAKHSASRRYLDLSDDSPRNIRYPSEYHKPSTRASRKLPRVSFDFTQLSRSTTPAMDSRSQAPECKAELASTSNAIPSLLAISDDASNRASIASFRSTSTTSLPAPSIVTQIYAPRRSRSSLQVSQHSASPTPSPSQTPSPISHKANSSLPLSLQRSTSSRPWWLSIGDSDSKPLPPLPVALVPVTPVHEPSLDLDCLDESAKPNVSDIHKFSNHSQQSFEAASSRKVEPVPQNPSRLNSPNSISTRSSAPRLYIRSTSPEPSSSVEEDTDEDDSELYFGSADESDDSEFNSDGPSSSSSPTSPESLKSVVPWENPHLSSAFFGHLAVPRKTRPPNRSVTPASNIRGYSPDDAAPPPISRVRKEDMTLTIPGETRVPGPSFPVAKGLSAWKPTLPHSLKQTFSFSALTRRRQPSISSSTLTAKLKPTKLPPALEREADLVTHSVPYDHCAQSTRPIETATPSALLPPSSKELQASLRKPLMEKRKAGAGRDILLVESVSYEKAVKGKEPVMTRRAADLLPVRWGWRRGVATEEW